MENLYEWWQLFDPKTKRYYYYNINSQKTVWHLPSDIDNKKNIVALNNNSNELDLIPLASRIVCLLIKNHALLNSTSSNDLRILYENIKRANSSINDLAQTSTLDDKCLKAFLKKNMPVLVQNTLLNKDSLDKKIASTSSNNNNDDSFMSSNLIKSKTSIVSIPLNAAMSSITNLSSSACPSIISNNQPQHQRRLLPRTNPNYVNVDMIDMNNGKTTIKNTYVKLQDLNDKKSNNELMNNENENDNQSNNYNKIITSSSHSSVFNSLKRNVTNANTNNNNMNKEDSLAKQSVTSLSTTSNNGDLYQQATVILLSILKNTEKEKTIKKNFQSMSNISLNTSLINKSINEDNCNKTDDKNTHDCNGTISKKSNKKFSYFTSKLNSNSSSSTNHKQRSHDQDDDNKSLHNHNNHGSNSSNIIEGGNFYNSISTTSISDMRNLYQKKQSQLNQKFQTLRRSFNTKTSLTKMQTNESTATTPTSGLNKILSINSTNGLMPNLNNQNISPTSSLSKNHKKNGINKNKSSSSKNDVLFDLLNSDHFKRQQQHQQNALNIREINFFAFKNKNLSNDLNTICNSNNDKKEFFSPPSPPMNSNSYINSGQSPPQFNMSDDTSPQPYQHSSSFKSNFPFFTRKKIEQKDIMTWSPQPIQKPILKTKNKLIKKEACELFKLIQEYMGDKHSSSSSNLNSKTTINTPITSNTEIKLFPSSSNSNVLNLSSKFTENSNLNKPQASHQDLICLDIIRKGWQYAQLRDELFLQLVKQTTLNLNPKSLLIGWQLIAICLTFFPPSQKLYPFFYEYINYHLTLTSYFNENDNEIETHDENEEAKNYQVKLNKISNACKRRLERINVTGAKKGLKVPQLEEILLSKYTILSPSLFGSTLNEIMSEQQKKCPLLNLPWIQTTLSEAILRMNGAKTEGIFRVPGDLDEVNNLKVYFEQIWCTDGLFLDSFKSINDIFIDQIHDPHLPASLLKLWYRELHEPLIPDEYYNECIQNCENPTECIKIIEKLPKINKLVFNYLIRFLKVFAASENVAITKMDANNLSMIMAPNCLRCKSNEAKVIMENTKKEMQFIKTLIQNLDTSIVQGML